MTFFEGPAQELTQLNLKFLAIQGKLFLENAPFRGLLGTRGRPFQFKYVDRLCSAYGRKIKEITPIAYSLQGFYI
jgi:hypothetical protein